MTAVLAYKIAFYGGPHDGDTKTVTFKYERIWRTTHPNDDSLYKGPCQRENERALYIRIIGTNNYKFSGVV